jgi:hypothetical protein
MKKFFALIAFTLMANTNMQAQNDSFYNTRHDLGIAIGGPSNSEILGFLTSVTELAISATVTSVMTGGYATGYYTYGEAKYVPTISAEYYYHVSKVVAIGGMVTFNSAKRDMFCAWTNNVDGTRHEEKTGTRKLNNLSVIPTVKIDWLRKRNFGLYSKAGLGVTMMHETQKDDQEGGLDYKDNMLYVNFHASLIGAEFGSESFRGFTEVGMGEQGIFVAGLRYKF